MLVPENAPPPAHDAMVPRTPAPRGEVPAVVRDADTVPQVFARSGHAPTTEAVIAALRTRGHELIWMLSPPRALGDGRFLSITLHSLSANGSTTIVASISSDDSAGRVQVEGRREVPTESLTFPSPQAGYDPYAHATIYNYDLPAVDDVEVGDMDRDDHPEAAMLLRYSTPVGLCEMGFDIKAHFVVVRFDPEIVIAASIVTRLQPQVEFSPHRRGHAGWTDVNHDGHPDIVVTGQTCTGLRPLPDGGLLDACSPIHDEYLWHPETGTWLTGQTPVPGPLVRHPCR